MKLTLGAGAATPLYNSTKLGKPIEVDERDLEVTDIGRFGGVVDVSVSLLLVPMAFPWLPVMGMS